MSKEIFKLKFFNKPVIFMLNLIIDDVTIFTTTELETSFKYGAKNYNELFRYPIIHNYRID